MPYLWCYEGKGYIFYIEVKMELPGTKLDGPRL
jgi:hypothetical protein